MNDRDAIIVKKRQCGRVRSRIKSLGLMALLDHGDSVVRFAAIGF